MAWRRAIPSTAKRGAHAQPLLVNAPDRFASFEDVYGAENLKPVDPNDQNDDSFNAVRVITAAPEVVDVMDGIETLAKRGVIFSIGHRSVSFVVVLLDTRLVRP